MSRRNLKVKGRFRSPQRIFSSKYKQFKLFDADESRQTGTDRSWKSYFRQTKRYDPINSQLICK